MTHQNLLFFHGFLGGPEDWLPVIKHLPPYFVCRALDLNTADPLQQAKALLQEQASSSFFLIGYSMGGRIAWQLALHFSSNVRGLVVLSAHPGLAHHQEKMARWQSDLEWIALLEQGDMPQFLKSWYAQPLFDSLRRNEDLFSRLLQQRSLRDPRILASMLRFNSLALQPLLPDVSPTLFLHGAQDLKYANLYSNRNCDPALIEAIPESGHAAHVENPRAVAGAIQRFVESRYHDDDRI